MSRDLAEPLAGPKQIFLFELVRPTVEPAGLSVPNAPDRRGNDERETDATVNGKGTDAVTTGTETGAETNGTVTEAITNGTETDAVTNGTETDAATNGTETGAVTNGTGIGAVTSRKRTGANKRKRGLPRGSGPVSTRAQNKKKRGLPRCSNLDKTDATTVGPSDEQKTVVDGPDPEDEAVGSVLNAAYVLPYCEPSTSRASHESECSNTRREPEMPVDVGRPAQPHPPLWDDPPRNSVPIVRGVASGPRHYDYETQSPAPPVFDAVSDSPGPCRTNGVNEVLVEKCLRHEYAKFKVTYLTSPEKLKNTDFFDYVNRVLKTMKSRHSAKDLIRRFEAEDMAEIVASRVDQSHSERGEEARRDQMNAGRSGRDGTDGGGPAAARVEEAGDEDDDDDDDDDDEVTDDDDSSDSTETWPRPLPLVRPGPMYASGAVRQLHPSLTDVETDAVYRIVRRLHAADGHAPTVSRVMDATRAMIPCVRDEPEEDVLAAIFALPHLQYVQRVPRCGPCTVEETQATSRARERFLRTVRDLLQQQQGRPVVYVADTWFEPSVDVNRHEGQHSWSRYTRFDVPVSLWGRVLVFSAACTDTTKMDSKWYQGIQLKPFERLDDDELSEKFLRWFASLCASLPQPSAIVVDGSSHHWKRLPSGRYAVRESAKKYGHRVVYMPERHYSYNPLQQVWTHVKRKVLTKDIRRFLEVWPTMCLVFRSLCISGTWADQVRTTRQVYENDLKELSKMYNCFPDSDSDSE